MLARTLERIRRGLGRTRRSLTDRLGSLLGAGRRVDEDLLEQIEAALLEADVGVAGAAAVAEAIRARRLGTEIAGLADLEALVVEHLLPTLPPVEPPPGPGPDEPRVTMLVGVNGGGKTTTAGKLAARAARDGGRGILCAADTFRAAAAEQLAVWAERTGAELIRHEHGADPSAVVFDALAAAMARRCSFVIVDTAGRLHTKVPLMEELAKVHRVIGRKLPGAPHEVLLVVDATTGQNGVQQARIFTRAAPVTGLVLTKIDGTARGGVALAIHRDLGIPVRYLGVGEGIDDLVEFSPREYLEGLFGS
jgi:fused signal recognition particle receptor